MPLLVLLLVGCAGDPGPPPGVPGSGGGPLGAVRDTGGGGPVSWVGYDAARVTRDGVLVCDRVWDTVGVPVEADCEGCDFAFALDAVVREGVGAGEGGDCPGPTYSVTVAWRSRATADGGAAGLLTRTAEGWVPSASGTFDQDLIIAEGAAADPVTGVDIALTVVGRLGF
jgi:hypothetical protein